MTGFYAETLSVHFICTLNRYIHAIDGVSEVLFNLLYDILIPVLCERENLNYIFVDKV